MARCDLYVTQLANQLKSFESTVRWMPSQQHTMGREQLTPTVFTIHIHSHHSIPEKMTVDHLQKVVRLFLRRLDSHPLSTTFVTVGGFTSAGLISWGVMDLLEELPEGDPSKRPMTLEQARLRAMIENAQTSSWQENLDNAASAQAQFMLPGRPMKKPDFMQEIDKRSMEIMKEHNAELEKDRQRRPTTRIWSE